MIANLLNKQFYLQRKNCLPMVIVIASVFYSGCCFAEALPANNPLLISVDAQDDSFKDLIKNIANQLQKTVIIDTYLADKTISGSFNNITLETFLKKALKGENIIIMSGTANQIVEIRSFGKKSRIIQITPKANEYKLLGLNNKQQLSSTDLAEEQKKFEKFRSSSESIDPMTGMTFGEIALLQTEENIAFEDNINNPDFIDPLTGMTLSELADLRAREQKVFDVSQTISNN